MLNDQEEWMLEVGKSLKYNVKAVLGRGSYGSIVFSGLLTLDNNTQLKVAIKRLQLSFIKSNLIGEFNRSSFVRPSEEFKHANVLHYLAIEKDSNFLYLVTELCFGTLEHLVKGRYKGPPVGDIDEKDILLQITKGVAHLHNKLKIVHRDIKPSNVLISFSTSNTAEFSRNSAVLFKLADLGIISTLITDHRDFKKKKTYVDPHGTHGWLAPEIFDSDINDYGFPVDIFALGCVFGYTLSFGKHPFGDDPLEQSIGILEKREMGLTKSDFSKCRSKGSIETAINLIGLMLRMNPKEQPRPIIDAVLDDPFFSIDVASKGFDELAASSSTAFSDQKGNNLVFGPNLKIIDQVFSKGLIVFSVLYNDKPVAINRIRRTLDDSEEIFYRELIKLRTRNNALDEYFPEIIDAKINMNFKFIVTTVWDETLEDYIEEKCLIPIKFKDPREILFPVTKGLEYLHSSIGMSHGNIRPKSIFIYQKIDGWISAKISDLVTSAALEKISGLSYQYHDDILALGHLFAYTFRIGRNKYTLDEDDGIGLCRTLKKLSKLPSSKDFTEHFTPINEVELLDLIASMVDRNPQNRPNLENVLSNGFFREYERLKSGRDITDDTDDSFQRLLGDLTLEKFNISSYSSTIMEEPKIEQPLYTLETYCKKEYFSGRGFFGAMYREIFQGPYFAIKNKEIDKTRYKLELEKSFKLLNHHPNVTSILAIGKQLELEQKYTRYQVMEFAASTMKDLFQGDEDCSWIKRRECERLLEPLSDLQVLTQIARGLNYLHSKNIVHGNLKPANVLIFQNNATPERTLKLSDFGHKVVSVRTGMKILASSNNDEASVKPSSLSKEYCAVRVSGTPGWISPELIEITTVDLENVIALKGDVEACKNELAKCTTASDIFAYGLVAFYYLAKGVHPFGDLSSERKIMLTIIPNVWNNRPVNFGKIDLPVGDPTSDFVWNTLENDWKKRLNASELVTRLESLVKSEKKTRKATRSVDLIQLFRRHYINTDEPSWGGPQYCRHIGRISHSEVRIYETNIKPTLQCMPGHSKTNTENIC